MNVQHLAPAESQEVPVVATRTVNFDRLATQEFAGIYDGIPVSTQSRLKHHPDLAFLSVIEPSFAGACNI